MWLVNPARDYCEVSRSRSSALWFQSRFGRSADASSIARVTVALVVEAADVALERAAAPVMDGWGGDSAGLDAPAPGTIHKEAATNIAAALVSRARCWRLLESIRMSSFLPGVVVIHE